MYSRAPERLAFKRPSPDPPELARGPLVPGYGNGRA